MKIANVIDKGRLGVNIIDLTADGTRPASGQPFNKLLFRDV